MTDIAQAPAAPRISFRELGQAIVTKGVGMSHLSIELGHFYMDELQAGPEELTAQFGKLVPWVEAARRTVRHGRSTPRVSVCYLVDDYFIRDTDPKEIVGKLTTAARKAGVPIDYLARESACARAGDLSLAELVMAKIQAEPAPGTNGSRPPAQESGWLSNGERSPGLETSEAMRDWDWRPPREFRARNHSVFTDIELFAQRPDPEMGSDRLWACSFLASVWQLMRLGLLRNLGQPVAVPQPFDLRELPDRWSELPMVIQLNPEAHAFSAYRTLSVLPQNYLPIEHAVRTILDHVSLDAEVLGDAAKRAAGEGVELPSSVADRITHVFVEGSPGAGR